MATTKGSENDYSQRKTEKTMDNAVSRRTQKLKSSDPVQSSEKKQTRAKTRTAQADETAPSLSSVSKAREKGRVVSGDVVKDGDGVSPYKKDTENITPPKKETEAFGLPKKDLSGVMIPKKDITSSISVKKDLISSGSLKKDGEAIVAPKKDSPSISKRDEVAQVKNRKVKVKLTSCVVAEKKVREDIKLNSSKTEEIKSEVSTTEKLKNKEDKPKTERKENGTYGKVDGEKNREIMNSDVTSSVDDKGSTKLVRNHSPVTGGNAKESGWSPGDLAWGRVGQHPFWPCIIAVDHMSGQFTKTKRVGRGLNSVQQSLHVQFFGDNGRHSWIPTSCVIKYEGKEQFQKFADKVLHEMKKKDKKYSSAFIVKPSSKPKWEIAIREAESSVPKAREERIQFFQDLLPKKKSTDKADSKQKNNNAEEIKSAQLVKKAKRPHPNPDEKPSKQAKLDRGQIAIKVAEEKKKLETTSNTSTRKKRGRNKQTGNSGK